MKTHALLTIMCVAFSIPSLAANLTGRKYCRQDVSGASHCIQFMHESSVRWGEEDIVRVVTNLPGLGLERKYLVAGDGHFGQTINIAIDGEWQASGYDYDDKTDSIVFHERGQRVSPNMTRAAQ